jgi:prepilin-type N-terminal cleavage/methylation domain-containing protein
MRRRGGRGNGFTLVELMVVITVISILISLILKALNGSIRAAEQKATIALIAKLETALTDRVQALSTQHPEPTLAHIQLAGIWSTVFPPCPQLSPFSASPPNGIVSMNRAQVIAAVDDFRAELPDVFMVTSNANYPLNFAAMPCTASGATGDAAYYLPLGALPGMSAAPPTGIYGASFAAAAAVYEQLGYGPKGTDGADNDQDGLIDEFDEGTKDLNASQISLIQQRLANHKHNTARAEMLYAVLVNGGGPLGSAFSKDDFTSREVQDTDQDGLMEFVDAWGQPLQFYRNPVLYHSEQQRGFPDLSKISQDVANGFKPGPYTSVYEARENSPFDPNNQLLSPAWFATDAKAGTGVIANTGPPWGVGSQGKVSGGPSTFMNYFFSLVDPIAVSDNTFSYQTFWDRSAALTSPIYGTLYPRRAFYARFLVVSGGQDKMPGVAMLSQFPGDSRGYPWTIDYRQLDERTRWPLAGGSFASSRDGSGQPVALTPANLVQIENQGGMVDPNRSGAFSVPGFTGSYRNDTNTYLEYVGADDITTQNYQNLGVPQ